MQIVSYGLASIGITTKNIQREVRVVIDPYDNVTGLRFPRTIEAEMILSSHDAPEANNIAAVEGKPFVVKLPGEYEVAGVFVYGISAPRKDGSPHIIFLIEAEGLRLAHLGAMDRPLTDDEVTALGDVDILFVPMGGGMVLSADQAADAVQAIEPRAAVPGVYGKAKGVKAESPLPFVKALGVSPVDAGGKWKIARAGLPEEDLQVVTLS